MCDCSGVHKIQFTNFKKCCTSCGIIYIDEFTKPWIKPRGIRKRRVKLDPFPTITEHAEEYEDLLRFLDRRKLYLINKIKIEKLFSCLFPKACGDGSGPPFNPFDYL